MIDGGGETGKCGRDGCVEWRMHGYVLPAVEVGLQTTALGQILGVGKRDISRTRADS